MIQKLNKLAIRKNESKVKQKKLRADKHKKMHKDRPKGGQYSWDEKEVINGHRSGNN